MSKKSKIITITTVALLVLALAAIVFVYRDSLFPKVSVQPTVTNSRVDKTSTAYRQYGEMTGETYDRNFIANMIAHCHAPTLLNTPLGQITSKRGRY